MATDDFFRARIDQMIDLTHPLWPRSAGAYRGQQLEAALAPVLCAR
jgi:hypothetical protein